MGLDQNGHQMTKRILQLKIMAGSSDDQLSKPVPERTVI